jgi:hypothetical protein
MTVGETILELQCLFVQYGIDARLEMRATGWSSPDESLHVVTTRLETDEEYERRWRKAERNRKALDTLEQSEYNRLKAKFENKDSNV